MSLVSLIKTHVICFLIEPRAIERKISKIGQLEETYVKLVSVIENMSLNSLIENMSLNYLIEIISLNSLIERYIIGFVKISHGSL